MHAKFKSVVEGNELIRKSMFGVKKLALTRRSLVIGLAIAITFASGFYFLLPHLGGVRVDADSNKLMTMTTTDRKTNAHIFRAKYRHPESFQDYVFVYDPKEVTFDRYSVNYQRRKGKINSGPKVNMGEVFPENREMRMISMPGAVGMTRKYTQPSGSKDPNFVQDIVVQFFLDKGERTDAEYEAALEKFKDMGTKGRFMVKKEGEFVEVARSGRYRHD